MPDLDTKSNHAGRDRMRQSNANQLQKKKLSDLGMIASYLAHEIRNPLNAMSMQTAVIENGLNRGQEEDMARARQQLKALRGEIARLDSLVESFLVHGRLNSARPERINLPDFLHERVDFIRNEGLTYGIDAQLEIEKSGEGTIVLMVPAQLEQVLLNLVKNAFRAMEEGGGRLTLRLSRPEPHRVSIVVADTGSGIDTESLAHIFVPFVSGRPDGNGLGLTITKQIVEAAGGRISADSQIGFGSRFEISLPLVEQLSGI